MNCGHFQKLNSWEIISESFLSMNKWGAFQIEDDGNYFLVQNVDKNLLIWKKPVGCCYTSDDILYESKMENDSIGQHSQISCQKTN